MSSRRRLKLVGVAGLIFVLLNVGNSGLIASDSQDDAHDQNEAVPESNHPFSQIFGLRGLAELYNGVESTTSVQDPDMSYPYHVSWSAGPVGITEWYSPPLIEGGTIKWNPHGSWIRCPYVSFDNAQGGSDFWCLDQYDLAPASYQTYSVFPAGGTRFYVSWCDPAHPANCHTMANINMHASGFSYAGAGGEGACESQNAPEGCPIGYINTKENRFRNAFDGNWYAYCYTQSHNNVQQYGGVLSSCNHPDPSWWINYL